MASNSSGGKVAIVTGGGIGHRQGGGAGAAGRRLARGHRRPPPASRWTQVVAEAGAGGRALAVPTDVTDPASVEALFAATVKAWGRVDLLFNNAGVGAAAAPLEDLPLEQWKRVVDTNLNGMFYGIQQAFRVMKAQTPHGRAHHQQRLDLGARAAAAIRSPTRRPSTR